MKLENLQENVLMSEHTTYRIGGAARYFVAVQTPEQVAQALRWAKDEGIETLVLGGGSNLLVSDEGFNGLVVKMELGGIAVIDEAESLVEVGAGVTMDELVNYTVSRGLEGLEWAGGLPGTFGGAVRGNAGAFGGEIKDSAFAVKALDGDLNLVTLDNAQCQFHYRDSIFKQKGWVVLSATLKLKPGNQAELEQIAEARRQFRRERHPLEYPNSGSVFKNVPLGQFPVDLVVKFKEAGVIKKDPFEVVPTAYLSSKLGLKGTTIGNARISEKHPNFLVNLGGAKAKDILALITLKKAKVKEGYGVDLEVEVQLVGLDQETKKPSKG